MKKKTLIMFLLVCAISLSGCGLSESNELMNEAKKYIENGEYDKAMTNLSKVIDDDESNTEARGMYYQAMKLEKASRYDNRHNYEQEIKELQDILNDNTGSAKVRSQAEEQLEKAQKAFENQKKAVKIRKENAAKTAEKNKNRYADGSTYSDGYSNSYNKYNNNYSQKNSGQTYNKYNKYGSQTNKYNNQGQYNTNTNKYNTQGQYGNSQGTAGQSYNKSGGNTQQGAAGGTGSAGQ